MQEAFPQEIAPDVAPLGTILYEDCLYGNVWRPNNDPADLPVVVWIYGGGFLNGGLSAPVYSGEALANKDVVFYSFNTWIA